jgi:hypothetical protein
MFSSFYYLNADNEPKGVGFVRSTTGSVGNSFEAISIADVVTASGCVEESYPEFACAIKTQMLSIGRETRRTPVPVCRRADPLHRNAIRHALPAIKVE